MKDCKMMVDERPSLVPIPKRAQHMYIEVIEKRIRFKEKLTEATRRGIDAISHVNTSMQIYLTSLGNAFEMLGHLKEILPSLTDLRLLRYHLYSIKKGHDWCLIMNDVEDKCNSSEQRKEYVDLRKEEPFIDAETEWINKIFSRSEVNALDIED